MGAMASGAIVLCPLAAQAASLTQWHYDPAANRLEVTLDQGITPRYFLMAQPARIVLDLPDTAVGAVQSHGTYSGVIRQIRVSQFQPGLTRIVMELSPDVELAPGQVKLEKTKHPTATSRWVLHPLIAQTSPIQPSAKAPVPPPATPTISEPVPPAQAAATHPPTEQSGNTSPTPFPIESPAPVRVAPLSSQPAQAPGKVIQQPSQSTPAKVVNAEKILPPPTPIPIGSDDGLQEPGPSQLAQALPPASATPLPPNSFPSELAIDTRNAIKISVPPPLSGIQTQSSSSTIVKPLAPAAVTPLAPSSSPTNSAPAVASPPVTNSFAMDMPSTVRVLPKATSGISVPALGSSKPGSVPSINATLPVASSPQATPPLPPQAQLPSLTPLPSVLPTPNLSQGSSQAGMSSGVTGMPSPGTNTLSASEGLPTSSVPNFPAGQAPLINVPPLMPIPTQTVPPAQAPVGTLPLAPPSIVPPAPAASAPLQPSPDSRASAGIAVTPSPAKSSTVVAFGQPLPTTGAIALNTFPRGVVAYPTATSQSPLTGTIQPGSVQQAFFQSPNPSVLLPLGATLNLVYPGSTALKLPSGPPLQEVLLLQTEVRDATGNVVLPQGTYILGRFDTSGNGSKFTAQAIAVGERTIPFAAESNPLSNNRELSTTSMAIGSGVGALLGGAVSSFSGLGLVGGAAAGAATSFLTSPKQVTLQPGQIIQVQVKQDLLIR